MKSHTFYTRLKEAVQRDLGPESKTLGFDSFAQCASSNLWISLLKKATDTEGGLTSRQLKAQAVSAFEAAESACSTTNQRFRFGSSEEQKLPSDLRAIFHSAQVKIDQLIGDYAPSDLFAECHHGPGVTASINEDRNGLDSKYDESRTSVTSDAYPILRVVTSGVGWALAKGVCPLDGPVSLTRDNFIAVEVDKISFVPKSATSLRPISIGPTGNVYLQLGIGRFLQRRLLRWGIDLRNQGVNNALARWGSSTDEVATVDLKQASALLAREFVRYMLPNGILFWLDKTRVSYFSLENGDRCLYQQYSGMGNGFTFPLQTMIFYSLAWACCVALGTSTGLLSVYGDDIVIPTDAVPLFFRILEAAGLVVNKTKSFVCGPFRESCGGQWYHGRDVRPVYWKGFAGRDITAREVVLLDHLLWLWEDRIDERELRLHHTHRFLSKTARVLDARVPVVPMNAPPGSGLVARFCALDDWVGRVYQFIPLRREGRSSGLYCASLDSLSARNGGPGFLPPESTEEAKRKLSITKRKSGTWVVRRKRQFLGFYPR